MIELEARVIKRVWHNDSFYIYAVEPTSYTDKVQMNKYGNVSITGDIGFLVEGEIYEFILADGKKNQYGVSYPVDDVPSVRLETLGEMSYAEKFGILMNCTSSERLASNILDSYPNFIELILTEGKEAIDLNRINGVGEVYLNAYVRELTKMFKYYSLCKHETLKPYNISQKDAKVLYDIYSNQEAILRAFKDNPYYCLIEICGRKFDNVDKTIVEARNDLIDSFQRTEALIIDVLRLNEYEGSTRLNGSVLYRVVKEDYNCKNLIPKLKDVAVESQYIYFDEDSGDLSVLDTYVAECNIAQFVKEKIKNSTKLDIPNIEQYKTLDGSELTDQQFKAVENLRDYNFSLLTGYSGCVDSETEYFNGKTWKKISEYDGGKVLQYNQDGTATLIDPNKYIKLPCDEMYHFETKYGLNQTLSGDHTVVYHKMSHSKLQSNISEIKMEDLYKNHCETVGFTGKFITTFSYSGSGIDLTDDKIRLMVATMADGSFCSKLQNNNTCRFHIKKERKKERLRQLFLDANVGYREVESQAEGYTDFYYTAPRREKSYTNYWYNCSKHQLEIICDEIFHWDGYVNVTKNGVTRRRFSTTIKESADFVQFALTACGYRSTIKAKDRRGRVRVVNGKEYITKSIDYEVNATEHNLIGFSLDQKNRNVPKTPIEKVKPIDGFKYCFNVPSHMLVLRRNNKIFITGNCGKTTSTQSLIRMCDDNNLTYTLLAPTGTASMRLSESTHREATTIHLKCLRDIVINTDVLIVDECSMIGLDVFNMMLTAINNPNIRVVLVGDPAQLVSIAQGTIFSDIIESDVVPKTTLTKVFRYGESGILYSATNERQGKYFLDDDCVKHEGNTYSIKSDYFFIHHSEDEEILEETLNGYFKLIKKGIKPKDILLLTGYNVGDCGALNLNNIIQKEINPPKPNEIVWTKKYRDVKIDFRVGDRIMNIKNNYKALNPESYEMIVQSSGLISKDDLSQDMFSTVYNGQRGVIIELTKDKMVCKFDNDTIVYQKNDLNDYLLLSYAMTIHKSQGSESPYVITIYSPNQKRVMNRNLLYVGDTRAKKRQIDIGDLKTFRDALLVDGVEQRNTWLKELIIKN